MKLFNTYPLPVRILILIVIALTIYTSIAEFKKGYAEGKAAKAARMKNHK